MNDNSAFNILQQNYVMKCAVNQYLPINKSIRTQIISLEIELLTILDLSLKFITNN